MSTQPYAPRNRRYTVIAVWAGILSGLCCMIVLVVRFLTLAFPVSLRSPDFSIEQLPDQDALAFSYMRIDVLRPFELYVLDEQGIRCLSQGWLRGDIEPLWSPDGIWILYGSVQGTTYRRYLVRADGSDRREIVSGSSFMERFRWSPGGSQLAYLAYHPDPEGSIPSVPDLCVAETATWTTRCGVAGNVQDYVWMPDGRSLLVLSRADERVSAEVYGVDGQHQRHLGELEGLREAMYTTLSPDGTQVAYIVPAQEPASVSTPDSLRILALDGSVIRSVDVMWMEGAIVWSPDSTRIAFVALTADSEYALYVMNADGTGLRELMLLNTGDESGEIMPGAPAWSPDSQRIAIGSYITADRCALLIMNADGSEQRRIVTATDGMFYNLAWRPR